MKRAALMLTYLPLLHLPEWKALSRRQRRFLWVECLHPVMSRWPFLLARSVLLFCALMPVVLLDTFHGWQQILAIFIAVFLTCDVFDMILVARFRQHVVEYIQKHGEHLESLA